ncbi:hypothetical protein [Autumnicola psychrophila]|uniref:Uncharacterized protein n=1 Tax=Autumnicola psychrophila TaxID=3075592 RepID=A0ABU3DPC6_9FLAO|nr:hypothetical protein [Zunongwangia sp. F225]MDT0685561.1 hypothetical protein [Zunongwangia sp. F225]
MAEKNSVDRILELARTLQKESDEEDVVLTVQRFVIFLKKNIAFLSSIPILLGGIFQVIYLLNINFSFLKFFSGTQMVSDGLLMIFPFLILLFCYFLWSRTLKGKIPHGIMAVLLTIIHIPVLIKVGKYPLEMEMFILTGFTLLNYLYSFLIPQKNRLRMNALKGVNGLYIGTYGLFLFLNGFSFINSKSSLQNMTNIENVYCFLGKEGYNTKNSEILYYNDKYLFVEMGNVGERKVRIYPFQIFLDFKACRN